MIPAVQGLCDTIEKVLRRYEWRLSRSAGWAFAPVKIVPEDAKVTQRFWRHR